MSGRPTTRLSSPSYESKPLTAKDAKDAKEYKNNLR
jgi:hypothetical protein